MKKMKQSLRRLALAVMLAAALSCCVFAAEADPAAETPAQFYNAMQAHLDQREESFSIVYTILIGVPEPLISAKSRLSTHAILE